VRNEQETEDIAASRIRRWLADPERLAAAAAGSGDPRPLLALAAQLTRGRSSRQRSPSGGVRALGKDPNHR
jgi:hypothetical protein